MPAAALMGSYTTAVSSPGASSAHCSPRRRTYSSASSSGPWWRRHGAPMRTGGGTRLGDGHDGELHAEGVGPGRGHREAALGGRGPVDAGDEVVDAEWGITAPSSGSGWTTKGPTTTTGWPPRSMMSRAVEPIRVPAMRPRPCVDKQTRHESSAEARRWMAPATSVSTSTWMRGSSGIVPRARAASAADAAHLVTRRSDGDGVDGGAEADGERAGRGDRTVGEG